MGLVLFFAVRLRIDGFLVIIWRAHAWRHFHQKFISAGRESALRVAPEFLEVNYVGCRIDWQTHSVKTQAVYDDKLISSV